MKRKPPAERSIGIDLDARAIERFSCGTPVELVHGCARDFLDAFPFEGHELVCSDPPASARPAAPSGAAASSIPRPIMWRCWTG